MSGSTATRRSAGNRPPTGRARSRQGDRPPGLGQVPWILLRFAPYYLRHVVLQPYRGLRPLDNVRELLTRPARRHQIAVYDAVFEFVLKGYAELAGHPLHPQSGRVAVMLTRVGFAFDDEYEHRKARQQATGFEDLIASAHVQQRVGEWRAFMQQFDVYDAIRDFLMTFVARLYQDYADTAGAPNQPIGFDAMMRGATLDSGGLLVALAQVLALFHHDTPTDALLRQFSCLGVNGKLADDVIDFRLDVAEGRHNLLLALADDHAAEHARAISLAAAEQTMSTRWWQRNCPRTYRQLVAAYEEHQAQITSGWLRYVSRLMWTPALLGHARKKETRGRILRGSVVLSVLLVTTRLGALLEGRQGRKVRRIAFTTSVNPAGDAIVTFPSRFVSPTCLASAFAVRTTSVPTPPRNPIS